MIGHTLTVVAQVIGYTSMVCSLVILALAVITAERDRRRQLAMIRERRYLAMRHWQR